MKQNTRWSLKRRLLLQVVAVAAILILLGVLSLLHERSTMLQDREDKVRNLAEVALSVVKSYEERAAAGQLSDAEAQRQAVAVLNGAHYNGGEYFFAFDRDWNWVVHGAKAAMIGKNAASLKEGGGRTLREVFEETLNRGGGKGQAHYIWDKPGFDTPQPKVSYVATSPKWGWVVGTGIYLDDVQADFLQQALQLAVEVLVALVVVVIFGTWLRRSVMQQLGAEPAVTRDVVHRIAEGDLHVPIPIADGDKDSLLAAVADMQQHLRELVGGIANSSRSLAGMAGDITGSAGAVAASSDQQSHAATEMAAAIEELTASIKQVAELADHARDVSANSGELSNQGGEVIASAVVEMQRINAAVDHAAVTIDELVGKTETISTIMQVIKDIADQTNLLALNAAIEAARAGESGRGFAVVADEVRKLSERTAGATQEIADMIRDIQHGSEQSRTNMEEAVSRVKAGLALAEQGGEAIRHIRDSANGVVGVVKEISQALTEQGNASEEITRNVEQIAQAAANNAEASGTTSSAMGELNQLTERLRGMVARFQV
ncbi:methyl-accepting chemotaxis protein [Vogesella sp. LIG4]|uniref:methyl-accepting chemotaxis protein n=1 Tax=Vogesella sp. LIG4 TaxID=1192162 RepID=UPI00081F7D8B|nr:methyl-accepting chemotaxis protein [Vogesella sp. LIG4]SCK10027.1 methyl-accepting chemotaxis sensory transducer with Cache sensor [Vogesella sp. LIG4]